MKQAKRVASHASLIATLGLLVIAMLGCTSPSPTPTVVPTLKSTTTITPVPVNPKASAVPQPTVDKDDVFLWGQEVTLEKFIEICKSGQVDHIEWFMEQDRLRLFTKQGERYNYRNEKTRLDMVKVLQAQGLDVSANGLNLNYED
jgi:hypothetical protein